MIYLDGSLILVSPAQLHEKLKKRLGMFVDEVVIGLRIPSLPTGQTTFRRRAKRGGVEGDETYYITNEERVRGKTIDLEVDPPPDLAIEVVHTHPAQGGRPPTVGWASPRSGSARRAASESWCSRPTAGMPEPDEPGPPVPDGGRYYRLGRALYTGDELDWALELRRWVAEALAPRLRAAND